MAKLRILSALLFVAGFAYLFSDCTKSKNRTFQVLDNDSAVINHFNFMPGTYWIYQDALSGRIDSFYVRSNVYSNQTETYNVLQYHFITIAELNEDGTNPGDSANWVLNYQGNKIMLDYDYTTFAWGWQNEIQYRPLFVYPYVFGDQHSLYDSAALT